MATAATSPAGDVDTSRDVKTSVLTRRGGRVAWYHGTSHELIAFDRVVDQRSRDTEVFTIRPDGTGETCITCDSDLPKGFVGQPDWHPDGEHLVLQVENPNSRHRYYNHMSFGIDNDLWLIRRDGKGAERFYRPQENGAALHPHFDEAGERIVFSERKLTGRRRGLLRRLLLPGGASPWVGWRIHLADFDVSRSGETMLSNHRALKPSGDGFYETHGFSPGGKLLYTYTPEGLEYADDIYECDADGRNARNLIESRNTWDEHGAYSPCRNLFAFMSSRYDRSVSYPDATPVDLASELYVRTTDGTVHRVSRVNAEKAERWVVSDYDWDRDGRRIVYQVAKLGRESVDPELWIAHLPEALTGDCRS